jgi:hypothetical protein
MILQRDAPTKVWGLGAAAGAKVQVSVVDENSEGEKIVSVTTTASADGNWTAVLPSIPAKKTATMKATDGTSSASLSDVAFGDVILCGETMHEQALYKRFITSFFRRLITCPNLAS